MVTIQPLREGPSIRALDPHTTPRPVASVSAMLGPISLPVDEAGSPAYLIFSERIDADCLESIRRLAEIEDGLVVVAYSHGEAGDEIHALRAGADECVMLGFSVEHVLFRLRRLAKRRGPLPVGDGTLLRLDDSRYQVHVEGQRVQLSPLEFRLISELWVHRGRLVPHDRVEKALYGACGPTYRQSIRQVVHRLRAKLGSAGQAIHAVAGAGYVLSLQDEAPGAVAQSVHQ
jgi:two-component system response regulator BaeR